MFWYLVFSTGVLYFLYTWITLIPRNFPPGPPAFPIIGSALFIPKKKHTHLIMDDFHKKYGPITGLVLGSKRMISICEPSLVFEILKREEFQGRPNNQFIGESSLSKRLGIMFNDGPGWTEQRRFTLRHLKDFGFGKASMEVFVIQEIEELSQELENKTVQVSGLFNLSILNVLWSAMAGMRYKRGDPQLLELLQNLTDLFRSGGFLRIVDVFPFLQELIPEIVDPDGIRVRRKFQQLIRRVIHEHRLNLDENNPKDFIDVYLREMNKQPKPSSFSDDMLITICQDLFAAGGESVGNTLGFAIMYMVLYPEVQEKVQKEIDRVLERHQIPTLLDRSRLTYVEAVIMEIQRMNTIAPISVPHRAVRDTELMGYFIPKSTIATISLWSLLQDEGHWKDALTFKPERFLDSSGKIIKDEWFIPFGFGKRLCLGEAFARKNLFLFFTSLMQKFTVTLPPGHSKPDTLSLPGFTTAPQPFEVTFTLR